MFGHDQSYLSISLMLRNGAMFIKKHAHTNRDFHPITRETRSCAAPALAAQRELLDRRPPDGLAVCWDRNIRASEFLGAKSDFLKYDAAKSMIIYG